MADGCVVDSEELVRLLDTVVLEGLSLSLVLLMLVKIGCCSSPPTIFSCTGHGEEPFSLAGLNLTCGEKACSVAAFVPASVYLRLALKLFRRLEGRWQTHYDVSFRLYRVLCNVELCLGNFDSGNGSANYICKPSKYLGCLSHSRRLGPWPHECYAGTQN
jgi:hypothetical protein